jgi:hypothetical protein
MSALDWKLVQVVVYPPGDGGRVRMEKTVRLPYDAGFDDLLAALADTSPDVFAEVCGCVARASAHPFSRTGDDPPLLTLGHYFALGGPVVCPVVDDGNA